MSTRLDETPAPYLKCAAVALGGLGVMALGFVLWPRPS